MKICHIFVILIIPLAANAQVVQLTGGSSTLYESSGGLATVYMPDFSADLGAGVVNGTPALELAVHKPWRGWDLTLGSEAFSSNVGSAGLFTGVLGVTISKTTADSKLLFFAGDVQPLLGSAFFRGIPFRLRGGAGGYYKKKFKNGLGISSLAVASGKTLTGLSDVDFHRENFEAGAGGGWLMGKSLLEARSTGHTSLGGRLNLAASANFLRLQRTTFETVMAAAGIGGFGVYASKILGSRSGETYGANLRLGIFDLGANFMSFKGNSSLGTSLGERLGRHLVLREYATRSQGRWSESLGGSLLTNRFSVDVAQAVYFVPEGNAPLQRSMTVTVHLITPWKSSSLNVASGVDPSGKIRYGVDGGMFLGSGLGGPGRTVTYQNTGKFRIEGTVVDEKGQPVSGAAIRLGKDLVFSDASGNFFLRVKHNTAVPLAVVPGEFTSSGSWAVVSVPLAASPGGTVRIVVRQGMP